MDELKRLLLNHDGNFTIVTTTTSSDINNDTTDDVFCSNDNNDNEELRRQVVATRTIQPSEVIGNGLNVKHVLDPVEILQCSEIGQMVLHVANTNNKGDDAADDTALLDYESIKRAEQMAFWITIATMGRDAEERRRCQLQQQRVGQDDASSERTSLSQTKKKRRHNVNNGDNKDDDDGGDELLMKNKKKQEVYDAYLLSLPKEGPDPCSWAQTERNQLLHGTPLYTQIETTLSQIHKDYNRVVSALKDDCKQQTIIEIPPLSINGSCWYVGWRCCCKCCC